MKDWPICQEYNILAITPLANVIYISKIGLLFDYSNYLNISVPRDWSVVQKERQSGSYRMSSYYLAKTLSELPLTMVLPTLYLLISYTLLGASSWGTTFLHMIMLILNALVAQVRGFKETCIFL